MARTKKPVRKAPLLKKPPTKPKNNKFKSGALESIFGPPTSNNKRVKRSNSNNSNINNSNRSSSGNNRSSSNNNNNSKPQNSSNNNNSKKKATPESSSAQRHLRLTKNQQHRSQKPAPRSNVAVRKFQLSLPNVAINDNPAPWLGVRSNETPSTSTEELRSSKKSKKRTSKTSSAPSKKKDSVRILNCISVNAQALDHLNSELAVFGEYVSLTPQECQAREYMIDSIQTIANELFESAQTKFGYRSNNTHTRFGQQQQNDTPPENDVHVQVFGSFAARPVCTFESDIDLALWGVVPGETSMPPLPGVAHANSVPSSSNQNHNQPPSATQPQQQHPNAKKQAKMLKWKAVMDETEAQKLKLVEEQQQKDGSKKEADLDRLAKLQNTLDKLAKNDKEKRKKEAVSNQEQDSLFVIDRIGEPTDGVTEDTPIDVDAGQETKKKEKNGQETKKEKNDKGTRNKPIEVDIDISQFQDAGDNDDAERKSSQDGNSSKKTDASPKSNGSGENFVAGDDQEAGGDDDDDDDNESDGHSVSDDDTADKLEGLDANGDDETGNASIQRKETEDTEEEDPRIRLLDLPHAEETSASNNDDGFEGNYDELEASYREQDLDAFRNVADPYGDDEDEALGRSVVSLSSSTADSDAQDSFDDSGMEVSFHTSLPKGQTRRQAPSPPTFGPTGEARVQVVKALNALSKKLRKMRSTTQLCLRKHARVPIINMETSLGYECDIAVGGHNGTDTSAYASLQIGRFQRYVPKKGKIIMLESNAYFGRSLNILILIAFSFAVVVLLLKVLLAQQGLDKPFTGGLGSFKLYVLVANHIERHLSLGGSDNPAEVLLMFLFRYGGVQGYPGADPHARTRLTQLMVIESEDGGSADMGGVYQVENCVKVFEACFMRLRQRLNQNINPDHSVLWYVINSTMLEKKRRECCLKASLVTKFKKEPRRSSLEDNSNNPRAMAEPTLFSNRQLSQSNRQTQPQGKRRPSPPPEPEQLDTDDEAEKLIAGYNSTKKRKNGKSETQKKNRKPSRQTNKQAYKNAVRRKTF
jgi:hypothetical protein